MRYLSLFIVPLSVASFAAFLLAADVHAQPSSGHAWTGVDLDAAVDAAASAASRVDNRYRVRVLLDLAVALQNGAAPSRAPEIIQGAAAAIAADPTGSISGSLSTRAIVTGSEVVEELAQFGELQVAEAVVGAAARPIYRVILLGSLGVGRAKAGDMAGADNAVAEILSLATRDGGSGSRIPESVIARAGAALAVAGAPGAAVRLAGGLPDGSAKADVLAQSALAFCDPRSAADPAKGRELAGQAGEMAKIAARAAPSPHQQPAMVALAGAASARCDGPAAALAFVRDSLFPEQARLALGLIADQLTARGYFDLARALTASPDATDLKSLVDAAKRFLRQHDKEAARAAAVQAAEQIDGATGRSKSVYFRLSSEVFGILVDVGEYDRAVAAAGSYDANWKRTLLCTVVERAIRRGDGVTVARLAPLAINAATQPRPDWQLYWLTRSLAVAGFRNDAGMAYQQLDDAIGRGLLTADLVMLAELQALVGDLPAALATADRAGRPPADPGLKVRALQAIASGLAEQGNIDGALQVEAKLEAEPRNVLRDRALLSIAAAQARSGDLRGAYATSLRISDSYGQFQSLLRLVAAAPRR